MKRIFLLLCLFSGVALHGQTTLIRGTINDYAQVSYAGTNVVKATPLAAFSVYDTVLIIQMQGAVTDSTNTASFGSITAYNSAGNFEFLVVRCIAGDSVYFSSNLTKTYNATGSVQLVRVPHYTNATVTDTLTAQTWNGVTGGVLVFTVADTLRLSAPVNVSGKGFRGGTISNNPDGACGAGYAAYYYPISQGVAAEKGEGIAKPLTNKTAGRGALASGGGGGNKHNSGGAGGGNFSAGGQGGNTMTGCSPGNVGGIGGYGLSFATGRIFMGGGGGCSDYNNNVGTTGTNGGGIIIIVAGKLQGNGLSIVANGRDQGYISNGIGDGAGGGGAGGSVLLQAGSYLGSPFVINSNGGHGGDQFTTYPASFGPGGGGGIGIAWLSNGTLPAGAAATTSPGASGKIIGPASSINYNQAYGATDGAPANGLLYNLNLTFPAPAPPPDTSATIKDSLITCLKLMLSAVSGPAGAQYIWNFGDGTSARGNPVVHQYQQAGSYNITLSISGSAPCAPAVTKTISIGSTGLNAAITDSIIHCRKVKMVVTTTGNPAGLQWIWGDGSATASNPATHTYAQPGAHTVTLLVTNELGCTDTIPYPLTFDYNAPVTVSGDTIICKSGKAMLHASGGVTYSWQPAALLNKAAIPDPVASPVAPTFFVVTAVDAEGCTGRDSVFADIYAPPAIGITTDGREITCSNTTVQLFASGATAYTWQPAIWCSDSNSARPLVSPPSTTTFTVTGTDVHGCPGVADVEVVSKKDAAVYMPDAFTPNGDGRNDMIYPHMVCDCTLSLLRIYNRWGECVFVCYVPHTGWNGTYHGVPQPIGVYNYMLDCKRSNGEIHTTKGELTLIR